MRLNELPAIPGKEPKRKGRGPGSGNGKTAGRGTKGQHARSGGFHKVGFEGGQMPLQRRMPKRGFHNPFKKVYALVKISALDVFASGTEVTIELLRENGMIRSKVDGVKLLANGDVTKSFKIVVDKASKAAIDKIRSAGGDVVLLQPAVE